MRSAILEVLRNPNTHFYQTVSGDTYPFPLLSRHATISQMPKRGPKTPVGRAAVRLNAVRHAVLSQTPVLPEVESEKDWQAHRARLFDDLQPEGAFEANLVERIAITLWQLQRLARFHRAAVIAGAFAAIKNRQLAADFAAHAAGKSAEELAASEPISEEEIERCVLESLIPPERDLNKIVRYETHLNRQLYQARHELEALQDRRKGRDAPLARLDLNLPPN
jgi:hypothetical protein